MLYQKKTVAASMPSHPNILLIGVDTLRADAVGVYRPRRPSLTPSIDRLAAHGDVYLDAWSTANSTNPSFASILSGLYVKNTGVYDLRTPLPESVVSSGETRVNPSSSTSSGGVPPPSASIIWPCVGISAYGPFAPNPVAWQ